MTRCRNYRKFFCGLAAICVVAGTHDQLAFAQTRFSLSGQVSRSAIHGDDAIYRIAVNVQPFLSPDDAEIVSLVGPNGAVATAITPEWHQINLDNLTISDARNAFSGTWTFTEARNGSELKYQFDLPEVAPELFPSTPVIVSPGNGDVVGSAVVLDWAYPEGRSGDGFALRSSSPNGVRLDFARRESLEDSSARFPLLFDEGVIEGEVTLRVGQSESMFFDVTPLTADADASFVFQFVSVKSFSLPLTVLGRVPEPSAIVLVMSILGIVSHGRRSPVT